MKRIRAVGACLMFIATLSVLPGCSEKVKEGANPQDMPHVKGLSMEKVTESDVPELLEVVGTVKSKNTALIAARISGIVRNISVKEGDRVARGKHLITLEANESSAAAEAANSEAVNIRPPRSGILMVAKMSAPTSSMSASSQFNLKRQPLR